MWNTYCYFFLDYLSYKNKCVIFFQRIVGSRSPSPQQQQYEQQGRSPLLSSSLMSLFQRNDRQVIVTFTTATRNWTTTPGMMGSRSSPPQQQQQQQQQRHGCSSSSSSFVFFTVGSQQACVQYRYPIGYGTAIYISSFCKGNVPLLSLLSSAYHTCLGWSLRYILSLQFDSLFVFDSVLPYLNVNLDRKDVLV